jgi:hypothetical protein
MRLPISTAAVAAFALSSAMLCCAQTIPDATAAPHGAANDCDGMVGSALETCRQLNRSVDVPAPAAADRVNDCSGMTGAPLLSCRRLNEAETTAPRSGAGGNDDCSGEVGDALRACRALNGQPTETEGAATAAPER